MIKFFKLLWIDIRGYFYIRKVVRKNKKTVDFNRLGLRADWVNRLYTVINPSPEDKGDTPDVLKIKAQQKMLPIHKYVEKIGLGEVVAVSAEQIPQIPTEQDPRTLTDSYLLVYYPIFRVLTLWKIIWFFIFLGAGIFGIFNFWWNFLKDI